MDGVRDELLAGARLAPDEHGRVGLRYLCHLLVHPTGQAAGADDVGEVVPLPELLPQVRVLVEQPPPLLLDQPLDVERLPDHRAHDAEELRAALVVAIALEAQVHAECADRPALLQDRHADETQLLAAGLGPPGGPVEQRRLATDPRHDDGLAALDDLPRDTFAQPVPHGTRAVVEALGRFHPQLAVAQQRHHPAYHAVVPAEDEEDAVQRRL